MTVWLNKSHHKTKHCKTKPCGNDPLKRKSYFDDFFLSLTPPEFVKMITFVANRDENFGKMTTFVLQPSASILPEQFAVWLPRNCSRCQKWLLVTRHAWIRPSYLYNGNSHNRKVNWIRALESLSQWWGSKIHTKTGDKNCYGEYHRKMSFWEFPGQPLTKM